MILASLVLIAAIHTPEECLVAKGKPVATAEHGGKTYEFRFADCRDEFLTDPERYAQLYDALLELRTGRAAVVLMDYPPAVFATTNARTQGAFQLVSDVQYEPGLYGIAVAKDRPELRDAIAAALDRLVDSGTYQRLLETWDVGSGAVTQVTVNGAAPAAA